MPGSGGAAPNRAAQYPGSRGAGCAAGAREGARRSICDRRAVRSGAHDGRARASARALNPVVSQIIAVVAVAAAATALAVGALRRWDSPPQPEGDPKLVAVLPFRVAGADPALEYLREGMVDLFAIKLTGEGGPRALDPRAVLSSWHRALSPSADDLSPGAALGIAQRLGAGGLLDGAVVGTAVHLVLTAWILTVPGGATRARASVEGTADSLPALVDRLTAQLLAGAAGRTELLALTSLPALRAYVDGQAALRAGRFKDAFQSFDHALDLDSTFALAGVGLDEAKFWDGGNDHWRGLRLAWAGRDRLSPRDRALIVPWTGPNYPNGPPLSFEQKIAALQQIVAAVPESPEGWYELGDHFYHGGALAGYDAPLKRAAADFRRALDLDSSYAEPLLHLFDLSAAEGDTASVRRLGNIALTADSGSDDADYVRWQLAYRLRDTASLARIRGRFDQLSRKNLLSIFERSQETGARLDDARRAVAVLLKRADSDSVRRAASVSSTAGDERWTPARGTRPLTPRSNESSTIPRRAASLTPCTGMGTPTQQIKQYVCEFAARACWPPVRRTAGRSTTTSAMCSNGGWRMVSWERCGRRSRGFVRPSCRGFQWRIPPRSRSTPPYARTCSKRGSRPPLGRRTLPSSWPDSIHW